jgi:PAT family beta-lactamase induction signal transducer AmpG
LSEAAGGRGLILSENRLLRLFSFFILYVGQGLPLGVSIIAFPAWLVANGASDADVAAVIATTLFPWSWKFIPAAVMDRYAFLAMGRRRAWLIGAQLMMVGGFALAAFAAPTPDNMDLILTVVLLIGTGSAIQDVAVDGLAVDILPEEEQGPASAFMFGGQTIGRSLAGMAAGISLQFLGSQATFLLFLPVILLITLYVVALRERPGERRLPWSPGEASPVNLERHVGAWWPMAVAAFWSLLKVDSIKLVAGSVFGRMTVGMFTTMWPIIAVSMVGFTTASYSSTIATIDLIMAVVAIALGSFLTLKIGPRWSTVLVYSTYGLLALFVGLGQSFWATMTIFIVASAVWSLHDTMNGVCSNPLRMQLSDPKVAAFQFTVYNSISNLPMAMGALIFAALGGSDNLVTVMLLAAGLCAIAAMIIGWMKVGDPPVKATPTPEFD